MNSFRDLLVGNVIGKFVGVIREVLLAAAFGTGPIAAAYRVAQTATLIPVNFFTADALSAGFLPEHARRLGTSRRSAGQYYATVSRLLIAVSLLLALTLLLFSSTWVRVLGPGLDDGVLKLAASMLLVMALGVPFYISTALGSYLALSHGRHRLAALRPTIQSLGLIAGTGTAFLFGMPVLLAVGFTAAYVLLAGYTHYDLRRIHALGYRSVTAATARRDLGVFWVRVRPMLIAPLFLQGSWAVERSVATLIGLDAVAAVDYARLITDTIVVTIAAPLGLSLLVPVSQMSVQEARREVERVIAEFLTIFVPVSTVLAVGALPIVRLLFERGQFDDASTQTTTQILQGLALGVFAIGLSAVLLKALNGLGMNRRAATGLVVGCSVMVVFDLLMFEQLGAYALGIGAALGGLTQLVWFAVSLNCLETLMRQVLLNAPHFLFALLALVSAAEFDLAVWWPPVLASAGSLAWTLGCRPLRASARDAIARLGH